MRAGFGRRSPAWPASRPCAHPACPSVGIKPALPEACVRLVKALSCALLGTPWPALSSPCRLWRGGAPPPAPLGPACQGARQRDAWIGSSLACLRHRLRTRQDGQGRQDDQSRQDGQCRQEGRSGSRPGLRKAGSADQDRAGRGAESQRFGSDESLPGASVWRICRIIAAGRGLALSPLVRFALAESALRASGGMPAKAGTRRVTVWPADPGTSRPGLDASHGQQARAAQGEVSGGRPEASLPGAGGAWPLASAGIHQK